MRLNSYGKKLLGESIAKHGELGTMIFYEQAARLDGILRGKPIFEMAASSGGVAAEGGDDDDVEGNPDDVEDSVLIGDVEKESIYREMDELFQFDEKSLRVKEGE